MIEGVSKLGLSFEGKEVVLGAHLREPRVLRQGLLGPARWVTREVLAVTPMVFPTRREAAHNFCYNLCVKGLLTRQSLRLIKKRYHGSGRNIVMMYKRISEIRIHHCLITRDGIRVNLQGFGGWD